MSERQSVAAMGERIGYGNMMRLASELWGISLHIIGVAGGQFVVGPCKAMTTECECQSRKDCEWCAGSGWLTHYVKELKDNYEQD